MPHEEKVSLTFEVSSETADQLSQLVSEHIWERSEGLRIILGAGIGALITQRVLKERKNVEDRIIGLSHELVLSEGRLAATNYKLAEIRELIHRWEISSGALQEMGARLEKIVFRQNEEIKELKAILIVQEEENGRVRAKLAEDTTESRQTSGSKRITLIERLKDW